MRDPSGQYQTVASSAERVDYIREDLLAAPLIGNQGTMPAATGLGDMPSGTSHSNWVS